MGLRLNNRRKPTPNKHPRPTQGLDPQRTAGIRRSFNAEVKRMVGAAVAATSRGIPSLTTNNYDPDQPRDQDGRWSSGGGRTVGTVKLGNGEASVVFDDQVTTADSARQVRNWVNQLDDHDRKSSSAKRIEVFDNAQDLEDRLREVGIDAEIGEHGEVRGAFDFSTGTLYTSLWSKDKGDSHHNFLHEFGHSVVGENEDLAESWAQSRMHKIATNVDRIDMPQIRKENWDDFLAFVRERTTLTQENEVDPQTLRMVQTEWSQERVDAIPMEKLQWPILISDDGCVLDGNHRWIKAKQEQVSVKTLRIGLPVDKALDLMRAFPQAKFVGNSSSQDVERFEQWFAALMDRIVLQPSREVIARYVDLSFRTGSGRVFDDFHSGRSRGVGEPAGLREGMRKQFIEDLAGHRQTTITVNAFGFIGRAADKVRTVTTRVYNDLKSVVQGIISRGTRVVADAVERNKEPSQVTRQVLEEVKRGLDGMVTTAGDAVSRGYVAGQIAALRQLGVRSVTPAVEWTVKRERDGTIAKTVCKLCRPLDGLVFTVDEAEGLFPRHPKCQCSLMIPTRYGVRRKIRVDSKGDIEDAIARSRGKAKSQQGWARDVKIGRVRPTQNQRVWSAPSAVVNAYSSLRTSAGLRLNVFCATGQGGGVDPTCSPKNHFPIEQMTNDVKETDRLNLPVKQGVKEQNETCGKFGDCTNQAFKEWKENGSDLYVGYAIPKNRLQESYDYHAKTVAEFGPPEEYYTTISGMFPHAWNVKDGQLIDRALGSKDAADYVYFGRKVPQDKLKTLKHGDEIPDKIPYSDLS